MVQVRMDRQKKVISRDQIVSKKCQERKEKTLIFYLSPCFQITFFHAFIVSFYFFYFGAKRPLQINLSIVNARYLFLTYFFVCPSVCLLKLAQRHVFSYPKPGHWRNDSTLTNRTHPTENIFVIKCQKYFEITPSYLGQSQKIYDL